MESKERLKYRSSNNPPTGPASGGNGAPLRRGVRAKDSNLHLGTTYNGAARGAGVGVSMGYADPNPPRSSSAGNGGCSPVMVVILVIVTSLLASAASYRYYTTILLQEHDEELHQQIRRKEVGPLSQELQGRMEQLKTEKISLEHQLDAVEESRKHEKDQLQSKLSEAQKDIEKLQNEHHGPMTEVQHLMEYKDRMHAALQFLAKQHLIEKFGPGPHYVELQIAYDPESNIADVDPKKRHYILLELAPADIMPYTTYWFLEQVDRKLYDGTSFHRNAGHVIQAGPAANFLTPKNVNLAKRFKDSFFESVAFQEYSVAFPHQQYTVGYAGRPGGPDWYINMVDNTRNHGPGGQGKYEHVGEADPCFAKVVKGKDVVDMIHQSDIKPGDYKRMKNYVAIETMKIIKPKN